MGALFCEALFDNSGYGPGQHVDGRSSRHDREPYGPRPDYKESLWWKLIHNPQVHDPNHRMGKQFRRRFRVPFEIFQKLLQTARDRKWFPEPTNPNRDQCYVQLELKMLGALWVLGRGVMFDCVAEITRA